MVFYPPPSVRCQKTANLLPHILFFNILLWWNPYHIHCIIFLYARTEGPEKENGKTGNRFITGITQKGPCPPWRFHRHLWNGSGYCQKEDPYHNRKICHALHAAETDRQGHIAAWRRELHCVEKMGLIRCVRFLVQGPWSPLEPVSLNKHKKKRVAGITASFSFPYLSMIDTCKSHRTRIWPFSLPKNSGDFKTVLSILSFDREVNPGLSPKVIPESAFALFAAGSFLSLNHSTARPF